MNKSTHQMILPVTYDDLKKIKVVGTDTHDIVYIEEKDGFFLNRIFSKDFRIRREVYDLLKEAQRNIPSHLSFMVYEAYRPLQRQIEMWKKIEEGMRNENPQASEAEIKALTETFIANPYDGIGSGHQACCAIDISLCDKDGNELDMGTRCQEMVPQSVTSHPDISPKAKENRKILFESLENAGFANYPAEWWHYSYGDHQWAFLKGRSEAFFGPIDI